MVNGVTQMGFNVDRGTAVEDPEDEQDGLELPKPQPQGAQGAQGRPIGGGAPAPATDPNAPPPVSPAQPDTANSGIQPTSDPNVGYFRTGSTLIGHNEPDEPAEPDIEGGPTDGLEMPKPDPANQPKPPSFWDRVTAPYDPGAENFDAKHPIVGKAVRTLSSLGGSILNIPGSMYHMATDPVTPEEQMMADVGGAQNPLLSSPQLNRFTGATAAAKAASDYNQMKPSARQIAGVLPEALGEGMGNVVGGELIGAGTGAVADTATDFLEHRAETKGTGNLKRSLNTPAGKGGVRGQEMDRAVEDAKADLAEIERNEPGKGKTAQAYHDLADKIEARQDQIWETGHEPPIKRWGKAPIDHQRVAAAGMRELGDAARRAAPHEAEAAQKWIQEQVNRATDVQTADDLIREINDDLKKQGPNNPYGQLQVRAKKAVVKALRNEIDKTLIDHGEKGVKEVNRRWGALDTVKDRAREQAYTEGNAEGKKGKIPDWLHTYAFMHPEAITSPHAVAIGAGVQGAKMFRPAQGGKALVKGIRQLGKSGLKADLNFPSPEGYDPNMPGGGMYAGQLPAPTEVTELPQAGQNDSGPVNDPSGRWVNPKGLLKPPVRGLLPSPRVEGAPFGHAETVHPEMFPNQGATGKMATQTQRGPGGRMQKVTTGTPAPRTIGHTAEGGPMYESQPPAPRRVERPSAPAGSKEFDEKFGKPAKSRVDAQREEAAEGKSKSQGFRDKGRVREIGESEPGDRRKSVERRQKEGGTGPDGRERRTTQDADRRLDEVVRQKQYWKNLAKDMSASQRDRDIAQSHLDNIEEGGAGSFDESKKAFAEASTRKEAGTSERLTRQQAIDKVMADPKKKAKYEALDPKVKADERVMDQMLVDEQQAHLKNLKNKKPKGKVRDVDDDR